MRKRRKILIFLSSVLIIIVVIALIPHDQGPVYKGRYLEEWLSTIPYTEPERKEFDEAINAMGTNSLPYLTKWIAYDPLDPSAIRVGLRKAIRAIPILRRNNSIRKWAYKDKKGDRVNGAHVAFITLGPTAAPAIPDLEKLANESKSRVVVSRTTWSLVNIGPASMPAIIRLLNSTNPDARFYAVIYIKEVGTNFHSAIPRLLELTKDPSPDVATEAENALYSLRKKNAIPDTIEVSR